MAVERIGILCSGKSKFKDNAVLNFGNGADAEDPALYDVKTYWDGTNLILTPLVDDTLIEIGDSATTQLSFDVKWYANEASGASYLYFDASANLIYTTGVDLQFLDDDYLVFGTGSGATGDVQMYFDGSNLMLERLLTTENDRALYIETTPADTTHGVRQGALYISVNRTADYALASWDGNPDCGLKMQVYNRAVSGANGGTRGLDILARNRDSGSESWINGGLITAENSTGSGGVVDVIGLEVHAKNNGVASGSVKCLRVYDESQSGTGTNYGIELNCTANSPFAREYGIYIGAGAGSSWTNAISFNDTITNVLDFENTDGTNGATYSAGHFGTLGAIDGYFTIDIGGNTLYVAGYASIAA